MYAFRSAHESSASESKPLQVEGLREYPPYVEFWAVCYFLLRFAFFLVCELQIDRKINLYFFR